MKQGLFPFKYEIEKKAGGMTALAGLLPYLEFAYNGLEQVYPYPPEDSLEARLV